MISDETKIEVVEYMLNSPANAENIRKAIELLPLPELHKQILTLRFTIYLPNGDPNPYKCVGYEVGYTESYTGKLCREIMLEAFSHLKTLIIQNKI